MNRLPVSQPFSGLLLLLTHAALAQVWTPLGGPEGVRVGTLTTDPGSPTILCAGIAPAQNGAELYRSSDGGHVWEPLGLGFEPEGIIQAWISGIAVSKRSAHIYVGGIYLIDNSYPAGGALFASADRGATWVPTTSFQWPVTAVQVDPSSPLQAWAATFGGVFRTDDGGVNWLRVQTGPASANALAIDPAPPATLYAASASDAQVFRSSDDGATWSSSDTGAGPAPVASLAIDPRATATVYAGTRSGVRRSDDGGRSWTPASVGLPGEPVGPLVVAGTNDSVLLAWAGAVFRSMDGARSWEPFGSGLNGQTVTAFAVDPLAPSRVYASTPSGLFLAQLSPDGACRPDSQAVCAGSDRFSIRAGFSAAGAGGGARAVSLTPNTGAFWFFSPDNLELVVKVLDGRAVNGKWWVFYGALSNVEYTITVTDTQTGAFKTYFNPQGQLASVADTAAF